nr:PREDICTED: uncharacterized protein LOC103563010 [Equus przewalskii]
MPPFPHPPLSPSPQLGTDLGERGREAGQRASVPSILPAPSAANLGPSSASITPPPACPPAYPPNPKWVLDQVPNLAASSGMGVERQTERGVRTQRRMRAIAKTPRKKDGECWQSCLAPSQFPAEDGQVLFLWKNMGFGFMQTQLQSWLPAHQLCHLDTSGLSQQQAVDVKAIPHRVPSSRSVPPSAFGPAWPTLTSL